MIFEQDVDSDFGGSGRGTAEVRHTYEKASPSGGRQTVRRSRTETFLGSAQHGRVDLDYLSTGDRLDAAASRVSRLRWTPPQGITAVEVAAYDYLGAAHLVGTTLPEINAFNRLYRGGGSSGKYPQLDAFGRVATSNWWVDGAADVYKTLVQHDRNSNVTLVDDQLTAPTAGTGWDVQYTMDDLNRLTRAREGSWVTGSLGSFTRDEQWTLSRTGNWASRLLDLNGDGDSNDADEFTDAGSFNRANELTQRALSGGVSATYSPAYDEAGNLTNDGKDYTYEYDAFGRLRRVRNRATSALVAEYSYNGLGFRTSWKYDANASGTVDGDDPVYWFTHDERWRIVATYRGGDADPREVFVWHAAGVDGGGDSSYIDSVVLRQDDNSTAWTAEPDVLGRRVYPLQNWRADVVAVFDASEGVVAERVKYSAYGVPFCVSAADFDADGDVDSADNSAFYAAHGNEDPSADLNLDGVVDFNDILAWIGVYNAGETGGRSALSRASIRNRIGYAGYQHDPSLTGSAQASGQSKYHVRHRVYDASIGRWTRRDPLGYVDGMSVYEYVASRPMNATDPRGLASAACGGASCATAAPVGTTLWPDDSPPVCREVPQPPSIPPGQPCPVFTRCRGNVEQDPLYPPNADGGCGAGILEPIIPNFPLGLNFFRCCREHDLCYSTCNTKGERQGPCDDDFCKCLHETCEFLEGLLGVMCDILATAYCSAVRFAGSSFYCKAQEKHCRCTGQPKPPRAKPPTPCIPDVPRRPGPGIDPYIVRGAARVGANLFATGGPTGRSTWATD